YLQARLPDYMVPSAITLVELLPVTPSGKIDRSALPLPVAEQLSAEAQSKAPRTPLEELLAAIWCTVLQRDSVGLHDDFFALGGQSLLATQVIALIRPSFQLDIPLRPFFENPTVAALASCIATVQRRGQAPKAPPLVSVSQDGEWVLSSAQQRLWF